MITQNPGFLFYLRYNWVGSIPCLKLSFIFFCKMTRRHGLHFLKRLRQTDRNVRPGSARACSHTRTIYSKKAKKSAINQQKQHPPIDFYVGFCTRACTWNIYIAQIVYIWKHYICRMEILIINRISNGLAIGWTYYDKDEEHDYQELTFHIAIIDLRFMW